jgi:hypothetical protein
MNKGTLTILSDTHAVIGFPNETGMPAETYMKRYSEAVTAWLKDGGLLPLPFPVDVIDMRQPKRTVNRPDSSDIVQTALGQKLLMPRDIIGVPEEEYIDETT